MTCTINSQPITSGYRVSMVGSLRLDTKEIEQVLTQVVANHPSVVELDLCGLEFISSLGLGILLQFRRAVLNRGGTFTVVACNAPIADVLRRARLDTIMELPPPSSRTRDHLGSGTDS